MRLICRCTAVGSKLRMFAVDQLCYDRTAESQENIGRIGALAVVAEEDFNRDLLERLLEHGSEALNPFENGSRYMKVLDYDTCKVDLLAE